MILKQGDRVVLNIMPDYLIDAANLDESIKDVIGKPVRFNEIDEHGNAELEYEDKDGNKKFLWVDPKDVEKYDEC